MLVRVELLSCTLKLGVVIDGHLTMFMLDLQALIVTLGVQGFLLLVRWVWEIVHLLLIGFV